MRYAYVENGVVREAVSANPQKLFFKAYADKFIPCPDAVEQGWVYDGNVFAAPTAPQKSPEEIQREIMDAVQRRLDDFAKTRGYDNTTSASKYQGISDTDIAGVPQAERAHINKLRAEARYLMVATARTWAKSNLILAEVQAGTRPVPNGYTDIEPELPVLTWPN